MNCSWCLYCYGQPDIEIGHQGLHFTEIFVFLWYKQYDPSHEMRPFPLVPCNWVVWHHFWRYSHKYSHYFWGYSPRLVHERIWLAGKLVQPKTQISAETSSTLVRNVNMYTNIFNPIFCTLRQWKGKQPIWYSGIPKSELATPTFYLLYTHTAERRDVLGCTSPTTKRFPEAREMSRGQSPREIWRSEGMCNPIHSRQCTAILSSLIHP